MRRREATSAALSGDTSNGGSTGDIYIADNGTTTIHKYDGNLITGWGSGGMIDGSSSGTAFGEIGGIDVKPSSGQLVVFDHGHSFIDIFGEGSSVASSFSPCRGHSPLGMAVDPTGTKYFKVNGDESVERRRHRPNASRSPTMATTRGPGQPLRLPGGLHDPVPSPKGKSVSRQVRAKTACGKGAARHRRR